METNMDDIAFDNWRIPLEKESWQSLRTRFAYVADGRGGAVPGSLVKRADGVGGLFCFTEIGQAVGYIGRDVSSDMTDAMSELLPDLIQPGDLTSAQEQVFDELQATRQALRADAQNSVSIVFAEAATGKRWSHTEIRQLLRDKAGDNYRDDPGTAIYRAILMAFEE